MVNNELIDYIKSVKKLGHGNNSIKEHLIKHGYGKNAIEEAFSHPEINKERIKHNIPKEKKSKPWLIVLILFFLFVATTVIIFVYNPKPNVCNDVNLAIHELNNEQVLCVFPDYSKVQFILKNKGPMIVNSVDVNIKGRNGEITENLNVNMGIEGISTQVLDYGQDEIKKFLVTPNIVVNQTQYICKSNQIIIDEVKTC